MQSIATGLSNLLASLDSDKAKFLRIAQNNRRYEQAVRRTWSDNPQAAEYLLAHTNSLFFAKDDTPRKGAEAERDYYVLGVYLDDPTARAELNARRELLMLATKQEGLHFDKLTIIPATRGMKSRHLFPDSVERLEHIFNGTATQESSDSTPVKPKHTRAQHEPDNELNNKVHDQAYLLETVKRAICLSFENLDLAHALLEKIEGASLEEATFMREQPGRPWYWCHFYVSDYEKTKDVVAAYQETIQTQAKKLRLYLRGIRVHPSPETIQRRRAFPALEPPNPLTSIELEELRERY